MLKTVNTAKPMNPHPDDLPGNVFVYRNLHKTSPEGGPIYSIRDTATGIVAAHTETITLTGAVFAIGVKGRDRVRREMRKNVHAGVRGAPAGNPGTETLTRMRRAYYNPHTVDTFIDAETGAPLTTSPIVTIGPAGVHYMPHGG